MGRLFFILGFELFYVRNSIRSKTCFAFYTFQFSAVFCSEKIAQASGIGSRIAWSVSKLILPILFYAFFSAFKFCAVSKAT